MGFKLVFNSFLFNIILFILFTKVHSLFWSCATNSSAPVEPKKVQGVWYEIARIPSSDVPACVKVTAPEAESNGVYTLKVNYVNNVNNGWEPTEETLTFPWNEAENGLFSLKYGNADANVTVNFKYMGGIGNYSLVCGYTDFAPSVSLIRVLSRNQIVNSFIKNEIELLAQKENISLSQLTWVQQDGKCNSAGKLSMFGIVVLFIFYLLQTVL